MTIIFLNILDNNKVQQQSIFKFKNLLDSLDMYIVFLNNNHEVIFSNKLFNQKYLKDSHIFLKEFIQNKDSKIYFENDILTKSIIKSHNNFFNFYTYSFQDTYLKQNLKLIAFQNITDNQNLLKAKSDFLTLTTHQLKTPITGVLWALEMIKSEKLSDSGKDIMSQSLISLNNLNNTIDKLLKTAFIEDNKYIYSFKKANINKLIDSAIATFQPKANQKNIKFNFIKDKDIFINIDKDKILTVIENLFDNALKYSEKHTVINIYLEENKNNLLLSVENKSTPIKDKEKDLIFTKFYKGNSDSDGTGLGLYLCKQIIDKHNGKIYFVNTKDTVVFIISIPKDLYT
ncbi:MAG: HAMP domain-containing sensor histidine kinase [Candidatus Pacebacteria bacterium]|nr:HAMP domain-containing sensor histidine kinase [Candidatus Paceibacterota bacterium]